VLKVNDLHAFYGKSHILQGVTFNVAEGEIVSGTLAGPVAEECLAGRPSYTFSGISLLDPKLFAESTRGQVFPLRDVFAPAFGAGGISAELYHGPWCDVGTPARLAALNRP